MDVLHVGLIQMAVKEDKEENMLCAERMTEAAAQAGADVVVLPEMWNTPYNTAVFRDYAESPDGTTCQRMAALARKTNAVIVAGSIPELDEAGRIYNTSFVFNQAGETLVKHRKWHLFDIDVPGGQRFKESDVLSPGDGPTVFQACGWTFGLGICFDIRFPLQAEAMAEAGCEALIYPAAFNPTTGPLHWALLFRARAMDTQSWTIGVAPARVPQAGYVSWAHSLICDPWGTVRCDLGTDEGFVVQPLSKESIRAVRTQIPVGRKC